ncbi:MAG: hypothetical protein K8F26_08850 [Thiobacillus sp.]|nr:hypothetical protein [Thiobacillus sp.]
MSRWLHRELRIMVNPDQVTLLPVRRRLGLRGLRRTIDEPHIVSCDCVNGIPPWRAALRALETALLCFANGKTDATVILSNHFLRYVMVPWRAELTGAEEDLSFARHCFAKVYGKEAAQQWELRLSQEAPEVPRLASAVDTELLDAMRGVFGGAGITLKSVQPHLMAVFNGVRGHLRQRSAWFALLEPGNLCLALLHRGCWLRVRTLRIGSEWREDLALILEREAFLDDSSEVPHDVYLYDAISGDTTLPEIDSWQFHALPSGLLLQGAASAMNQPFAVALAG